MKNISRTYLEHKLKLIDLQADVEKQELLLQPLMDIDQPDQNKVGAQIDLITEARGKLEKENAMMMLAIRRWLSVEQWKTLKSLEATEERHNVFFMRTGPGMMEGPPPPLPGDMPAENDTTTRWLLAVGPGGHGRMIAVAGVAMADRECIFGIQSEGL